jgi:hypothetical protein
MYGSSGGVVSQGYGWLDRICADRFFEWADDGLISTGIQTILHDRQNTFIIREGYGTLFHTLYDRLHDVTKRPKEYIQSVQAMDGDGVRLNMTSGQTRDYDRVVLACDFSKLGCIPRSLFPDSTFVDQTWFISFVFTSTIRLKDLGTGPNPSKDIQKTMSVNLTACKSVVALILNMYSVHVFSSSTSALQVTISLSLFLSLSLSFFLFLSLSLSLLLVRLVCA